ncbi:hypothetical protein SAMN04488691_103187 [Haloferax larsenii]|uniref:Uncharacterized protein n=1 Tax=Haloferax larsenii TaxID=302484 RepID=A0A1H7N499_HALLR|nr:hypothetical protein SAMN04488691_103187 [Haloferax larsenii]
MGPSRRRLLNDSFGAGEYDIQRFQAPATIGLFSRVDKFFLGPLLGFLFSVISLFSVPYAAGTRFRIRAVRLCQILREIRHLYFQPFSVLLSGVLRPLPILNYFLWYAIARFCVRRLETAALTV